MRLLGLGIPARTVAELSFVSRAKIELDPLPDGSSSSVQALA
jgi:hypothetical protein